MFDPGNSSTESEAKETQLGYETGLADAFDGLPAQVDSTSNDWFDEGYREGYQENN